MVKQLTNKSDFEKVINSNDKVIIDFFATWCGPCKMLAPMLDETASKNQGWTILEINIDQFKELAGKYNVQAVPTLLFIKNKKIIETSVGFKPADQIQKIIDKI